MTFNKPAFSKPASSKPAPRHRGLLDRLPLARAFSHRAFLAALTLAAVPSAQPASAAIPVPVEINAAYDLTAELPVTVSFSGTSDPVAGPNATWLWDFGDGQTSTLRYPSHTYTEAGVYEVTVHVDLGRYSGTGEGSTSVYLDNVRVEDDFNDITRTASQWPGVDFSQILIQIGPNNHALSLNLIEGSGNQTAANTGVTMDQNQGGNGTEPTYEDYFYRFEVDFKDALLATGEAINIFTLDAIDVSVETRRFAGQLQMRATSPTPHYTEWIDLSHHRGRFNIEYRPDALLFEVTWTSIGLDVEQTANLVFSHLPSGATASGAFVGVSPVSSQSGNLPDFGDFIYDNVGSYRYAFP